MSIPSALARREWGLSLAPAEKESAATEYQHYEDDDDQSGRVHYSLRKEIPVVVKRRPARRRLAGAGLVVPMLRASAGPR